MRKLLLFMFGLLLLAIPAFAGTFPAAVTDWGRCVNVTASTTTTLSWIQKFQIYNNTINWSYASANGADIRIIPGNCTSINSGATFENITIAYWNATENQSIIFINSSVSGNKYWALYYNNSAATTISNISRTFNPHSTLYFNNETVGSAPTAWTGSSIKVNKTDSRFDDKYVNVTADNQYESGLVPFNLADFTPPNVWEMDIMVNTLFNYATVWARTQNGEDSKKAYFGITSNGSFLCVDSSTLIYSRVLSPNVKYHITANTTAKGNTTYYVNGQRAGNGCTEISSDTSNMSAPFIRLNQNSGVGTNHLYVDNIVYYRTYNWSVLSYAFSQDETQGGGGGDSISLSYSIPTPNNSQNVGVNFAFINVSLTVTGTADSCVLQWAGNNETMTLDATKGFCYKNKTGLADNSYIFDVFANTTTNVTSSVGTRTIITDTTNPSVTINLPTNTTYTNSNISINFTASDTNLDSCVKQLDGTNTSGCTNITTILGNTSHTLYIFANDTSNRTTVASVSFTVNNLTSSPPNKNFVVFGDSIGAGYYANTISNESFGARFEAFINASESINAHHVNISSVSGWCVSSLWGNRTNITGKSYNYAIVEIGTNDAGGNPCMAGNTSNFKINLTNVVKYLQGNNMTVVLVTNPPVNPILSWVSNQSQYNAIIKQVSQESHTVFIDLYDKAFGGIYNTSLMYDNVHPNTLGHEKIAIQLNNTLIESNVAYNASTYTQCLQATVNTPQGAGFAHKIFINSTNINHTALYENPKTLSVYTGNCTYDQDNSTKLNYFVSYYNSTAGELSSIIVNATTSNIKYFAIYYNNPNALNFSNISRTFAPKKYESYNNETVGNQPANWSSGISVGNSIVGFDDKYLIATNDVQGGIIIPEVFPQTWEFDYSVNNNTNYRNVWLKLNTDFGIANQAYFGSGTSGKAFCVNTTHIINSSISIAPNVIYHVTINQTSTSTLSYYINNKIIDGCDGTNTDTSGWTGYSERMANNAASGSMWIDSVINYKSTSTPLVYTLTPESSGVESITVNFVSPTLSNGTYNNVNFAYINVSIDVSIGLLDSCTLQWAGTNETMTKSGSFCYKNKTGLADNSYAYNVFANTTTNVTSKETLRNVIIDTNAPNIVINSPTNTTYGPNNITLAFLVSDVNPIQCTRELNGINTSMPSCNNQTFLGDNGTNILKIFSNDSSNNTNVASISFTVGSTPVVNISSPTNTTYYSGNITLNFTVMDSLNISACWYSVDGLPIVNLTNCLNSSFVVSIGLHSIQVWANNSINSIGTSAIINFTADYVPLLNVTAYNEQAPTSLVTVYNLTITNSLDIYLTKNTTTGTVLFIDASELPYGTYTITLSSDGYETRNYYNIVIMSNITRNVTAYLLNSSSSSIVQFSTKDQFTNPLQNSIIIVQKYINNTWKTIAEAKTSSSGIATIGLASSVIYTGNASYTGFSNITKTFTITDSPITFVFNGTGEFYFYYLRNSLLGNCALANSTTARNISCTVNDTASIVNSVSLKVNKIGNTSTQVCLNSSSSGSFFSLICNLPMTNGTYAYSLFAETDQGTYLLLSGTWNFGQVNVYGVMGLFIVFMLFLVCSFIGIYNPPIGIFLGIISLIFSRLLGLLYLGPLGDIGLVSIVLVGGIFMIHMSRQGGGQ